MADIYDKAGILIGSIPLSERQMQLLGLDMAITISFHTPQLRRTLLGAQNGQVSLSLVDNKIVTPTVDEFRRLYTMHTAVKALEADEETKRLADLAKRQSRT
jgi:hypothetical protein